MCHEPPPVAIVGVVVGVMPRVIVGVASKVVLWTDDWGPLVGLDKGGG